MIKWGLIALLVLMLAMLLWTRFYLNSNPKSAVIIPKETIVSVNEVDDTFSLEFYLINVEYFKKELIDSVVLKAKDPLRFDVLEMQKHDTTLKGLKALRVNLTLRVPHLLNEGYEQFHDDLKLHLIDGTTIILPIGPLSFVYENHEIEKLSYRQIHNVAGSLGYGVTSLGFVIELYNDDEKTHWIESIDVFSACLFIDPDFVFLYQEKRSDTRIKAEDYYAFKAKNEPISLPLKLKANATKTLLVPFEYPQKTCLLHRYPIHIDTSKGTLYVQSFPYIRSHLLVSENEPLIQEGQIDDTN